MVISKYLCPVHNFINGLYTDFLVIFDGGQDMFQQHIAGARSALS